MSSGVHKARQNKAEKNIYNKLYIVTVAPSIRFFVDIPFSLILIFTSFWLISVAKKPCGEPSTSFQYIYICLCKNSLYFVFFFFFAKRERCTVVLILQCYPCCWALAGLELLFLGTIKDYVLWVCEHFLQLDI